MSLTRSLFKLPTLVDPKKFVIANETSHSEGLHTNQNSFIRMTNSTRKSIYYKSMRILRNWSQLSNKEENFNVIIKNQYIRDVVNLPLITFESGHKEKKMEEKQVNTTLTAERTRCMNESNEHLLNSYKKRKYKLAQRIDILKKMDKCDLIEKSPTIGSKDMNYIDIKFRLYKNKKLKNTISLNS